MIELDDKLIKKFHQQKDGVYMHETKSSAFVLLHRDILSVKTPLPYSAICVLIKVIFSSESRAKYWD